MDKIKLQNMEEKTQLDAETSNASEKANTEGEAKTFTQEDLDKIISERLVSEKKKHERELKETVEKEKAEAERLAKLSAEEKEKELTSKQLAELQKKETELSLRENKLEAIAKLDELKIPLKLVDFIVDSDAEKMKSKLQTLQEIWKASVSAEVASQLKGNPPKDIGVNNQTNSKKLIKTAF